MDGQMGGWKGVPALPRLSELDGERAFAEVFVAWSEAGLYIAERCAKPEGVVVSNRRRPHSGDGLQVWIDARASQTSHRANRFCHHFILLPRGGGGNRMEPMGWQVNIRRARERPPVCKPEEIVIGSQIGEGFYTIEAFLPARILNGFEPHVGMRLGFNYFAHDIPGGKQHWSSPRAMPMETDPSLWGLLELVD